MIHIPSAATRSAGLVRRRRGTLEYGARARRIGGLELGIRSSGQQARSHPKGPVSVVVVLLAVIGSASLAVIAVHATVVARSLAELRSPRRDGAARDQERDLAQLTGTTV
ncbi:hypothetical protein [Nocardia asiatica]|uniref:hypothetical protein n=1 Tax=Nocardia asiatica TaxID=209252 RepID=UPI0005C23319|nr:hypothetical protein [Nocardia asiatica]